MEKSDLFELINAVKGRMVDELPPPPTIGTFRKFLEDNY